MTLEKIQEIKTRFNHLPPEQKTEKSFIENWNKFKLPSPKAAKWFYQNHIKLNSVLACCCKENF